jgi:ATP-dependent DNA helicase RecG
MQTDKTQTANPSARADTPVQYIKGVGPRMAEKLSGLGLKTLEDVLYYYPRDWEDRRQFLPIRGAQAGRTMAFKGTLRSVHFTETRGGFAIVSALITDGTGELVCKWMRRRSYKYDVLQTFRKEFQEGKTLMVHGFLESDFSGLVMRVDEHDFLTGEPDDQINVGRIVPIYPATEGLTPKFLRRLAFEALHAARLDDPLPEKIRAQHRLLKIK